MTRRSPVRGTVVPLNRTHRFDAGYTLDVKWNYPARCEGLGGWFFFNVARIQVLVSNGKVIAQDVHWHFCDAIDPFPEDGRLVLTTEEIGQIMGGN